LKFVCIPLYCNIDLEIDPEPGEVPKPRVVEDRDVILKVTGSTVCGSDLHLLHGTVIELEKGDILGHEFCGVVESMGSGVKGLQKGDRVVASFQIACGDVRWF
jgi:threonine dehydrogenase-like Zn-dependent dehydrogenase